MWKNGTLMHVNITSKSCCNFFSCLIINTNPFCAIYLFSNAKKKRSRMIPHTIFHNHLKHSPCKTGISISLSVALSLFLISLAVPLSLFLHVAMVEPEPQLKLPLAQRRFCDRSPPSFCRGLWKRAWFLFLLCVWPCLCLVWLVTSCFFHTRCCKSSKTSISLELCAWPLSPNVTRSCGASVLESEPLAAPTCQNNS